MFFEFNNYETTGDLGKKLQNKQEAATMSQQLLFN